MKKIILTALVAAATLSITSCNKDPQPIVVSPQYEFTGSVVDLMRTGVCNLFSYEEKISKMIVKGESLNPAITVHTDEVSGDTTGWESNFSDIINFRGKITVEFTGDPLADGSVKTINCSEITIPTSFGSFKLFGSIEVTNVSLSVSGSESEATQNVITNSFGWGTLNNDLSIDANYTFVTKYRTDGTVSECKIISGMANGRHVDFKNYSQEITDALNVDYIFNAGSMTMHADSLGYGMFPVDVIFSRGIMTIKFNEEIENIPIPYYQ